MPTLDMGKQVGPLPLGAWVVVVGAGLGLAYWSYRNDQPSEPIENIGGVPGVGTGEVGGWVPTQPPSTEEPVGGKPTTNEEWGRLVINFLIANNFSPVTADSAVRKYLAGQSLSPQEWALLNIGFIRYGSPPMPLPPGADPTTPPTAPPGDPSGPTVPRGHRISVPLNKNLYTWTAEVSKAYKVPYSLNIMRAMNPGIHTYIDWLPNPGKNWLIPVFNRPTPKVRIR